MKIPASLTRVTLREYIPMAGITLVWLIAGLSIGLRQTLLLGAAASLVIAARTGTIMNTAPGVKRRRGSSPEVKRQALKLSRRADLLSLAAGIAVIAGLVLLLREADRAELAHYIILVAIGFPARFLLSWARPQRESNTLYRGVAACGGALLMLGTLVLEPADYVAAAALGLKEWLAFGFVFFAGRDAGPIERVTQGPLTIGELAALSWAHASRRLRHLMGKAILGLALGPAGSIVMRTFRGVRAPRQFDFSAKPNRPRLALLGLGSLGIGGAGLLLSNRAEVALAASYLMRVAAAALAILLWSALSAPIVMDDVEDDDD